MRTRTTWALLAAAMMLLLMANEAAFAQTIDMAPICAEYEKVPLVQRNERPVSFSCDQLKQMADRMTLTKPLGQLLAPFLDSIASINLDDQSEDFAAAGCRKPETVSAVDCNGVYEGIEMHFRLIADSEGYVSEVVYLLPDMRALVAQAAANKAPGIEMLDSFVKFGLDVVIAKNATYHEPNLEITRVGVGLRARVSNIPRSSAPRIRIG